jgi:hypothetical protein
VLCPASFQDGSDHPSQERPDAHAAEPGDITERGEDEDETGIPPAAEIFLALSTVRVLIVRR